MKNATLFLPLRIALFSSSLYRLSQRKRNTNQLWLQRVLFDFRVLDFCNAQEIFDHFKGLGHRTLGNFGSHPLVKELTKISRL